MAKILYPLLLIIASTLVLSAPLLAYARPVNIGTPVTRPSNPSSTDPVTVLVNATQSYPGVQNVSIVYTTDNWRSVNTTSEATYNSTRRTWTATIPALASGGHVEYYIVAFDDNDNRYVNNNSGAYFSYDVTGGSLFNTANTVNWIIGAVVFGAIGAFAIAMLRSTKRPSSRSQNAN